MTTRTTAALSALLLASLAAGATTAAHAQARAFPVVTEHIRYF